MPYLRQTAAEVDALYQDILINVTSFFRDPESFEALKALHARGVTILLVEQNVNTTLRLVDRAYVLEQGKIVLEGTGQELLGDSHVQEAYLGI